MVKKKALSWFSLDQLSLFFRLLRDPAVALWLKGIPVLAFLYFLMPYDLIPDFIFPGIGEIDDIVILAGAVVLFNHLAPEDRIREHLEALNRKKDSIS